MIFFFFFFFLKFHPTSFYLSGDLQRVIMIGDHNQLPPVVKNMAFQRYANMEQSMFTRFVRLGVPTVDLDAQGRARASLASLYSWKYKNLGNLPKVQSGEYSLANPGFSYDYQVVDVGDYNGKGESEPMPHYYQNLGEAGELPCPLISCASDRVTLFFFFST